MRLVLGQLAFILKGCVRGCDADASVWCLCLGGRGTNIGIFGEFLSSAAIKEAQRAGNKLYGGDSFPGTNRSSLAPLLCSPLAKLMLTGDPAEVPGCILIIIKPI